MPHKNIVWLNGCFDVLHIGHIKLFQKARQMGLPVMVGIGTDGYYKDNDIYSHTPFQDRLELVKSIKYIDGIVAFSTDDDLEQIIKAHAPRYMMTDQKGDQIGSDYIKEIIVVEYNGTHKT
jgi:cytidyltransferase-like protein|tara:strand:+ start:919 stop:1281 length:363 start_codon:yes stop_codon:yes gene_type:complete